MAHAGTLWGHDAFGWDGVRIGLSLGTFGVCQTLIQATLPGPIVRRWGERWSAALGIGCTCVALCLLAITASGWIVFALMPLFALGGVGTPAFQALATVQVLDDQQGRLQGSLASVVSLASIFAPLAFSSFYAAVQSGWPGAIWLAVATVHLVALPIVFLSFRTPSD